MTSSIKYQDFAFMRNAKVTKPLAESDVQLLHEITQQPEDADKAMLLIHGFSSSPAVFRAMIKPLVDKGYAIYCPVLPGHGTQITDFAQCHYQQWLDCVEKAFNQLQQRYAKIDVLGLSLGGLLAYRLAQKQSVNHLYLLAPALGFPYPERLALLVLKLARLLGIKNFKAMGGKIKMGDLSELTYKKLPITAIINLFELLAETEKTPINCPIDLFIGKYDTVVSNSKAIKMLDAKTTIHRLENSAHVLPLDGEITKILDEL